MQKNNSMFITIEGIEGVGKSTAVATISNFCRNLGVDLVNTREPGGTKTGEKVRDIILHSDEEKVFDMTELLLVFAARVQNIEHVIKPSLAENKWVLCDRFTDASFAYQGYGRGLGAEYVSQLQHMVQGDLKVDITFLLDAPVDIAMGRIANRSFDRIEQSGLDFFQKTRDAYLQLAAAEPDRYVIINAAQELDKVTADIIAVCEQRLAVNV